MWRGGRVARMLDPQLLKGRGSNPINGKTVVRWFGSNTTKGSKHLGNFRHPI